MAVQLYATISNTDSYITAHKASPTTQQPSLGPNSAHVRMYALPKQECPICCALQYMCPRLQELANLMADI